MRAILPRAYLKFLSPLLALTAVSCAAGGATQPPPAGGGGRGRGEATVPVTVSTVVQKSMPIEIRVIGSVEAYSVVSVHAQVTGQLTAVNFKEGDDVAKDQLQYATISAPIAGRTGALMVYAGNLVQPTDAKPLVVINQVAPIYVSFAIPESRLPELRRYMGRGTLAVEAKPPSDDGMSSHGNISFVDNNVDQTTGTIRIKATFSNEDHRLWPGQFVNVAVALTKDPSAVVVPTAAVQVGQQGQYTYVVKADHSIEYRAVVVERTAGLDTVIKSGLKPAETVVTDGHLRIVAGSRVSIKGDDSQQGAP